MPDELGPDRISRADLIEAIEVGIRADRSRAPEFGGCALDDEAIEKLREYGRTASKVVRTDFWNEEEQCGCPMTGAGLVDHRAALTDFGLAHVSNGGPTKWKTEFFTAFDAATIGHHDAMQVVD